MIIDSHSHYLPLKLINEARKGNAFDGITVIQSGDKEMVCHQQGARYALAKEFYDIDAKLAKMDALGIDISILSTAPTLFEYWSGAKEANRFCQSMNDCLADYAASSHKRIFGVAQVPLQDQQLAVLELRRAVRDLGFLGAQIGTAIEGVPLDDDRYEPFFSEACDLNIPLFLHPYSVGKRKGLEEFQLNNLVGNPFDTNLAAVRMILSGFLDRYPDLKIILPHGGGYLPYQIGRLDHNFKMRPGKNINLLPPSDYLKRFYYDTILFKSQALKFLFNMVEAERLLGATDIPFDAADEDFKSTIESLDISQSEKDMIFYRNAQELFQISC
jgi:aminocarboxymuconate-semialdehyde decarboxylase